MMEMPWGATLNAESAATRRRDGNATLTWMNGSGGFIIPGLTRERVNDLRSIPFFAIPARRPE